MTDTTLKVIEASTGGTDLGAVSVTQGATPVKIGKQTIVDQAGAEVPFAKDASVLATNTLIGTAGGTTAPPNGTGVIGWLRGIYDKLVAGIAVTGTQTDALTNTQLRASAVPVSGTVTSNQGTPGAQAWPVAGPLTNTELRASAVPVNIGNFPATQNVALTGTGTAAGTPVFDSPVIAGAVVSEANPIPTRNVPANLAVQSQSAAAAASTLTLPAPGPGLFHYIDVIEIHLYATAARTGAAAPVTVTSTNLPAALSWLLPTGQAIGTIDRYAFSGDRPMKSATANTATTIVAPAVTGGIVQMKAVYSVGP